MFSRNDVEAEAENAERFLLESEGSFDTVEQLLRRMGEASAANEASLVRLREEYGTQEHESDRGLP